MQKKNEIAQQAAESVDIPNVPEWAMQEQKPTYTASEVGADAAGTASSAVSAHNTDTETHRDIRLELAALLGRINAIADSDDTTLDQLSEIVAYIKDNRDLIDQVTTGKVSVTDIVNNLVSNVDNKPLSAAQGVALKTLIDELTNSKANSDHTHSNYAAASHTHSEYAAASHTHSEYAAAEHTHPGYEDRISALEQNNGAEIESSSNLAITITDQSEPPCIESLTIYGMSTQDGTPSPENPVEIVSVGDGGSVKVVTCGKNLADMDSPYLTGHIITTNGEFATNSYFNIYRFDVRAIDSIVLTFETGPDFDVFRYGLEVNGVVTRKSTISKVVINTMTVDYLLLSPNVIGNATYNVQVFAGDAFTAYEPYRSTTATLTNTAHPDTPIFPLRGIPVDSGGNVTIDGQQYIADTLQVFADGSGAVVRKVYSNTLTKATRYVDSAGYCIFDVPKNTFKDTPWGYVGAGLNNYYGEFIEFNTMRAGGSGCSCVTNGDTTEYIALKVDGLTTEEEYNAMLSARPLTIITEIFAPQTIPLTAAEVQAFLSVQTFKPVTNIYNDAGALQKLVYTTGNIAVHGNLKKENVLQKMQIEELQSAILSLGANI